MHGMMGIYGALPGFTEVSICTRVKIDLLVPLHPRHACAFVWLLALLSVNGSLPELRWCYPRLPASCLLNKKGKFLVLWIGMMQSAAGWCPAMNTPFSGCC